MSGEASDLRFHRDQGLVMRTIQVSSTPFPLVAIHAMITSYEEKELGPNVGEVERRIEAHFVSVE
jgi:hypothetical protein